MSTELQTAPRRSLIATMAGSYGMGGGEFYDALLKTVMPSTSASQAQVAAFLMVANKYQLNPFAREIYAFPAKGGGIQPIVGIDGWMTLANRQPTFDGIEHEDHIENGKIVAITAKVHRKDRSHPISVTEYMSECARNTEPWKQMPARMLRHRATIQAIRYAFGLGGIMEPDEYEAMGDKRQAARDLTTQLKEEARVEIMEQKADEFRPAWADEAEELVLTPPNGTAPEEVEL